MMLTMLSLLLLINIIGIINRKRAWSKIFLFSQTMVVFGLLIMVTLNENRPDQMAKSKSNQLKNIVNNKSQSDTTDYEKKSESKNLIKF